MKVCLDPGHPSYPGNKGAVKQDFQERIWTLDTARKIWAELHRRDIRCDLTRHDYTTPVGLSKRQAMSEGYDLYLSLHVDKNKDPRVSGMVAYVREGDDVGTHYAQSIINAYGHRGTYVLNDRVRRRSLRPFVANDRRFKRVYNCIRKVQCPALLLEAGYISNHRDERRLRYEPDDIVAAVVKGIAG